MGLQERKKKNVSIAQATPLLTARIMGVRRASSQPGVVSGPFPYVSSHPSNSLFISTHVMPLSSLMPPPPLCQALQWIAVRLTPPPYHAQAPSQAFTSIPSHHLHKPRIGPHVPSRTMKSGTVRFKNDKSFPQFVQRGRQGCARIWRHTPWTMLSKGDA